MATPAGLQRRRLNPIDAGGVAWRPSAATRVQRYCATAPRSAVDAPRLVSSGRQTDPARVGGHRLDAGGPGRRVESQPHHLRRKRHDLVLGRRAREAGPQRLEGAGDVARRTVTNIPSPAPATTSAHRRALTSV